MSDGISEPFRGERRRRLLSLSATVGVILIAIVVAANFGMYRLDRAMDRSETEVTQLVKLAENARVAQVTFKTQVQEWKNTLLRGYRDEDYAAYHGAFLARRAVVQDQLAALELEARAVGFPTDGLSALKAQHSDLGKAYDAALQYFKAGDPLSVRIVDAHVRGRDRPVNEAFDRFVREVWLFTEQRRAVLVQNVADAAAQIRLTLWIALAVGFVAFSFAVFAALRVIRA